MSFDAHKCFVLISSEQSLHSRMTCQLNSNYCRLTVLSFLMVRLLFFVVPLAWHREIVVIWNNIKEDNNVKFIYYRICSLDDFIFLYTLRCVCETRLAIEGEAWSSFLFHYFTLIWIRFCDLKLPLPRSSWAAAANVRNIYVNITR
jgi:hypothetical protein